MKTLDVIDTVLDVRLLAETAEERAERLARDPLVQTLLKAGLVPPGHPKSA